MPCFKWRVGRYPTKPVSTCGHTTWTNTSTPIASPLYLPMQLCNFKTCLLLPLCPSHHHRSLASGPALSCFTMLCHRCARTHVYDRWSYLISAEDSVGPSARAHTNAVAIDDDLMLLHGGVYSLRNGSWVYLSDTWLFNHTGKFMLE